MNLKSNILAVLMVIVLIFSLSPLVSASLGSFKQGDCVNIKTILNSSFANLSTVSYPDSSIALTGKLMTKRGYSFNYSFCNTSTLGTYIYDYNDDSGNVYVNDFIITPTGYQADTGKSMVMLIGLGFIIILGLVVLLIGFYQLNIAVKIFLIAMGGILIVFSIGITLTIFNATIAEFSGLTSIINIIYIVGIALLSVGIIGVVVWLIVFVLEMFSKYRGFRD
jgi:hypothetical protein